MPVSKQIDESKQLTTFTVEGEVTFEEVAGAVQALYQEETPTKNVLWDASNGDVANLTAGDIERLASFSPRYSDLRKGGKTALYCPGDVAFGLSRMFEIIGEVRKVPIKIKVFRDKNKAMQWLDEN